MLSKKKFIEEIENITKNFEEPCSLKDILSEEAYSYFESLKAATVKLPEKSETVLVWMQQNKDSFNNAFSAKIVGEGLFLPPRSISGSFKKLVDSEYVKKIGENPAKYELTESGINYKSQSVDN